MLRLAMTMRILKVQKVILQTMMNKNPMQKGGLHRLLWNLKDRYKALVKSFVYNYFDILSVFKSKMFYF